MNPILNDLRDIQLPEPVSAWPWAIGWYALAALTLLTLVMVLAYFFHRWRRLRSQRYLLKYLELLRERYQAENDAKLIASEVSIVLRRASFVSFPRQDVAGLKGEQWLKFLDETGKTEEFSQGIGRVLLSAPYQAQAEFDVEALLNLVARWVVKSRLAKKKRGYSDGAA